MTVVCPICKSPAQELLHKGDAAAFHCPTHGDFKVADTVFANAEDYTESNGRLHWTRHGNEWSLTMTRGL